MRAPFTHLDGRGRARMVDVSAKPLTQRRAVARCRVVGAAGDPTVLDVGATPGLAEAARLAGIQAAKRTDSLIPLCHSLPLGDVTVELSVDGDEIRLTAAAETFERTGVEMEALTACAVAALTVVAACATRGSTAVIDDLALWEKSGGRSGSWSRPVPS